MVSNSEYSNLLNKYNRLVAENNDLKDQMKQSKARMQEREATIKIENDLIRKLCEEILAKDSNEMVVGTEYSWSNLPMRTLIEKTSESYKRYNSERNKLLLKISDMAESRAEEIEDLTAQIQQMQLMMSERGTVVTQEEVKKELEKQQFEAEAKQNSTYAVKEAEEEGNVELIYTEDEDVTVETTKAAREALEINASMQVTEHSIPVSDSRLKINNLKKEKAIVEELNKAHVINLGDYQKKFNDVMYKVLECIGGKGTSLYNEIEEEVLKACEEAEIVTSTARIRAAVQNLVQMGILEKQSLSTPLTPRQNVSYLSLTGHRIYTELYGHVPQLSEYETLSKEHDNAEHGYGIQEIARIMLATGKFKKVEYMNGRHPIVIKGGGGVAYVPDIMATTDSYKMYIEYERGTHTQPDFENKLEKMMAVTRFLNIIVTTADVKEVIIKKALIWIEKIGRQKLKGRKLCISTARYFADHDPGSPNSWMYVQDLGSGDIKTLD